MPLITAGNSVTSGSQIVDGIITDADVSPTAGIAITKISGGAGLVNADIKSNAAIAVSKLAAGTDTYILQSVAGVPTWAAPVSVPAGAMTMYGGAAAPSGWLLADGTSYLRATYPDLFTAIGTAYGSADATHFNVPDMRGRVPAGVGTGTGGGASGTGLPTGGSALTAVSLGTWKGEETHTLDTTEMPSHNHSGSGGTSGAGSKILAAGGTGNAYSSDAAGGGLAHNNIQPVMGVNFIIKT